MAGLGPATWTPGSSPGMTTINRCQSVILLQEPAQFGDEVLRVVALHGVAGAQIRGDARGEEAAQPYGRSDLRYFRKACAMPDPDTLYRSHFVVSGGGSHGNPVTDLMKPGL